MTRCGMHVQPNIHTSMHDSCEGACLEREIALKQRGFARREGWQLCCRGNGVLFHSVVNVSFEPRLVQFPGTFNMALALHKECARTKSATHANTVPRRRADGPCSQQQAKPTACTCCAAKSFDTKTPYCSCSSATTRSTTTPAIYHLFCLLVCDLFARARWQTFLFGTGLV